MDRFERIGAYYDGLVEKYGHDPRACDYGRPASQQIKFQVLSEIAPLGGNSLLDVGCGFADFADFLGPDVDYTGVDLSTAMVTAAQQRRPDLSIRQANVLEEDVGQFDYVMANGIFYLLGDEAETIMRNLVTRMAGMARKAVAFNSLSLWAPDAEAGEFYADPTRTVDFCRTITPRVTLRHDYHTRDFTIYLYLDR